MKITNVLLTLAGIGVTILLLLAACGDDPVSTGNDENGDENGNGQIEGDVEVYLSMGNRLQLDERQHPIPFSEESADITIEVDASEAFQSITGFGAAMTGSSAYLIRQMDTDSREQLLTDLFDPEEGIGVSNIRLTIGSSDFSLSTYSYCDEPGLENFAIPDTDMRDLIPVMQQILKINPDIWIMASPWSAPAWMKDSNSMNGGSLKQEHFDDFAHYLKMFVQAYEEHGIPVHALTVQNEPLHETGGYPTMYMPWQDQNEFIRDHLGPLFEEEGLQTEIIIWDHNWDNYNYPIQILDDPVTREYVVGSAFHGYAGDVGQMSNVHRTHPDKELYFTEISGGGWATNFWSNIVWNYQHIFFGSLRQHSKNALLWNMALDENDGPKNGGCQNCRGVVTVTGQSSYQKNEEYYMLAHIARDVRPGSKRISSSNPPVENLDYMAFEDPQEGLILVVINTSEHGRRLQVQSGKGSFIYSVPGNSLATFVW